MVGCCHEVGDLLLVDNLAVAHRADIMAHEVSIPGIAAPRVLHRSTVRGVVGGMEGELRSVVKFYHAPKLTAKAPENLGLICPPKRKGIVSTPAIFRGYVSVREGK